MGREINGAPDGAPVIFKIHDKYQFEAKLQHDLGRGPKKDAYRVETFFFLPDNLDINPATYDKKQFYRDLRLYIRFKTPVFSLDDLLDVANPRSPLYKIEERRRRITPDIPAETASLLDYEIRLFGCILKSALRELAHQIKREAQGAQGGQLPPAALDLLASSVAKVRSLARMFHSYRSLFKRGAAPDALASAFAYTDEYVSLLIEGRAHQILHWLDNAAEFEKPAAAMRAWAVLIEEEGAYRESARYGTIIHEDGGNEDFVFRLSALKKFVSHILHLKVRKVNEGKGLLHFAMALSAGIAMASAVAVLYFYQRKYGTLSFAFCSAVVVSYMFRDRLKAFMQSYFNRKLAQRLYDESTHIFDRFSGQKIGRCREVVSFADEKHLDPVVGRLRNRDFISDIENDFRSERILHAVRDIELFPHHILKPTSRKTALNDISRFDVRRFLAKMDETDTPLFYLKNGKSASLVAARIYPVNVVLKFTSGGKVLYERIRLVLTQDGIRHIERCGAEEHPASKESV